MYQMFFTCIQDMQLLQTPEGEGYSSTFYDGEVQMRLNFYTQESPTRLKLDPKKSSSPEHNLIKSFLCIKTEARESKTINGSTFV